MKSLNMKRWVFTYGYIFCWIGTSWGQQLSLNQSVTRAVVVGISDYQDEKITDLQYAHKDAEAFVAYLQSKAGGELPDAQIRLLTNEKATTARMVSELDWLMETCQKGDKAIIYFSGHGDVETRTKMQLGFLLSYDSPPTTYVAGAFPLSYLQAVIFTLSQEDVQVVVITDACRSGNLAGSKIQGAGATGAVLAQQYANEVKILSCQPDEFSLEGEQWGGGRSVFSYHLLEGMYGHADRNNDLRINLLEIGRYLEDKVSTEVDPESQIPFTVGNKGASIAFVDEETFQGRLGNQKTGTTLMAAVNSKGVVEDFFDRKDTTFLVVYRKFKTAIAKGDLLAGWSTVPKGQTADDYYQTLVKEPSVAPLHPHLTRQFAVALQEEAQQAINAYLKYDAKEMDARWTFEEKYSKYPDYLERAIELLGTTHYMNPNLMARKLYFTGLVKRLQYEKNANFASVTPSTAVESKEGSGTDLLQQAISDQQEALTYEEGAAFIYNELGLLYADLKQYEPAIENYQHAIRWSPEWGLPYSNLGNVYELSGQNKKAEQQLKKAIELQPNEASVWYNLGIVYRKMNRLEAAEEACLQAVGLKPSFAKAWNELGLVYKAQKQYTAAETAFRKAMEIDPDLYMTYNNLGFLYLEMNRLPDAVPLFEKTLEYNPDHVAAHVILGKYYFANQQFDTAETHLLRATTLDQNDLLPHRYLAMLYDYQNRIAEAKTHYLQMIVLEPDNVEAYYGLASLLARKGENSPALERLEVALQKGFKDWEMLDQDPVWEEIRKLKGYSELVKKYRSED